MKKTYIWRGLCTLLVLVFSLTMFGQSLAFTREGDVNLFLGTLPPAVQVTGDTNYYPSSYASMDEMRAALKDHLIESQEELRIMEGITQKQRELGLPVTVVDQDGFDLLDAMLGRSNHSFS